MYGRGGEPAETDCCHLCLTPVSKSQSLFLKLQNYFLKVVLELDFHEEDGRKRGKNRKYREGKKRGEEMRDGEGEEKRGRRSEGRTIYLTK